MYYAQLTPLVRGVLLLVLQMLLLWNAYQLLQCILRKKGILPAVGMGILIAADYYLMQIEMTSIHAMVSGDFDTVVPFAEGNSPVWVHFAAAIVLTVLTAAMWMQTRKDRRNTLSPISVKEALDALPTGICYYEPNGRVVLKNNLMEDISREAFGKSLLNGNRFHDEMQQIFKRSNGSIYLMRREETTFRNRQLYLLTAAEITMEYAETEKLKEQQEKAGKLSERIREYRQQIKETTIEEETLRAKVRIHDELGEALLSCRRFLKTTAEGADASSLFELLEKNAVMLQNEQPEPVHSPYEQVFRTARNLDVTLDITGDLPEHPVQQKVVATALHECITNTLRHAGGDRVSLEVRAEEDSLCFELTNNGKPPAGPIRETGGLAELHKLVQAAGGRMELFWDPVFLLRITLPAEVDEYVY